MHGWPTSILIFFSFVATAQSGFKNLRYNEDYSYLLKDSLLKNQYDRLKASKLGERSFVSLGGEVRYLIQNYVNEDWGDTPVKEYTAFYSRFLFHADVHIGRALRGFIQLNSTFANGRVTPIRSIDENRLSVHQSFIDIRFSKKLTLRAGRQELLFGSQRLVSVREGPNNRLSFDAANILIADRDMKVDLFYARPLAIRPGALDDKFFNETQSLWGGYAVVRNIHWLKNVDLYYLGYHRQQARFDKAVADELRHSFGTRWWGKSSHWEYDMEALYQSGRFGEGSISAWTASMNTSYTITELKKPVTLGMKAEFISGDRDRNDDVLNTFNPLYPRGAYFGLAALIGPSNLIDVHPSVKIELRHSLTLSLDYDLFWRQTITDGIYGPNGALIYPSENATSRFIGDQVGINGEYQPNQHISIVPEFTWFKAGPYLKEAGTGKDVFFSALTVQFKY
jgi:hypothetical protein